MVDASVSAADVLSRYRSKSRGFEWEGLYAPSAGTSDFRKRSVRSCPGRGHEAVRGHEAQERPLLEHRCSRPGVPRRYASAGRGCGEHDPRLGRGIFPERIYASERRRPADDTSAGISRPLDETDGKKRI